MARRSYSDDDRAACLAALSANGGNLKRTAKQCGVPVSTLKRWLENGGERKVASPGAGGAQAPAEKVKEALADVYERVVRDLLAGVTADKVAAADVLSLVRAARDATDKMQLLRDRPTQITDDKPSRTAEERAATVAALLDVARARRSGQGVGLG